ncbi:MAG: esterase-like activity of phytase family protein [Nocardioides sp.]
MTTLGKTSLIAVATAALASTLMTAALPAVAGGSDGADTRRDHHPATKTSVATLVAHSSISADYNAGGPPSGAAVTPANGRTGPFPGQVIPGFSAVVDAGDGLFWAQPDNGFGAKTNSADFLLRLYKVDPHFVTADGGSGDMEVIDTISYADPDHLLDFPIVNESTPDRLLTGADFDPESLVVAKDGTLWVGEEFGPFILHFDADGTLLDKPFALPGVQSPQNPYLGAATPTIGASRGFEAMAGSGRYLYPITEGALSADTDQRRRWVLQFDTVEGRYTSRKWAYEVDTESNFVADAFATSPTKLLIAERDNFDGPASVTKRVYAVDLPRTERDGFLAKSLTLDLLKIANPDDLTPDGGYGHGEQWSFPVQSYETVVGLSKGRLLIANDNNYPGNAARFPGTPDDTEIAIIDFPRQRVQPNQITLVGHRGASGHRPEHTLASYEEAINQCADYIEPDLVSTKDGVLVARHENEISGTTNVASVAAFADRRTTKVIDGVSITGWFTEDFTLAELRTLRATERIPAVRPANTVYNGLYPVPTLDEVLDLARHSRTCSGDQVGVYPETKHPTYFDSIGLSLEEPLLVDLAQAGLDRKGSPVFVQSFEISNLKELNTRTGLPLVQLINCTGQPYDVVAAGGSTTVLDMVTAAGMAQIGRYADGVGPCKDLVIPRDAAGNLAAPTPLVANAHRARLVVHPFTFRVENTFLPAEFRSSTNPVEPGDLVAEIEAFRDAGIDGLFTDNPAIAGPAVRD